MGCNCGGGRKLTTQAARPVQVQTQQTATSPVSAGYSQTMNTGTVQNATPVKRTTI